MKILIKSSLVALAVITSNLSIANTITPDFLINEIKTTHKVYFNASTEVAIYAMESFVRLLESDQSFELLQKTGPHNLSLSYVRLGFLYEKSGLKEKADKSFSKAVARNKILSNQSEPITLNKLKEFVNQLDAHAAAKKLFKSDS